MNKVFAPLLALLPLPALAHPHVFIDVGLDVILNETGQLTHIRVTWAYDEYYSLLIAEDRSVDQDFDGQLTPEEEVILTGFDTNWMPGFEGDLVVLLDGQELRMSGPSDPTATMVEGRIISSHLRDVVGQPALAGTVLSILPYDKTFYTAYEVAMPVTLSGSLPCLIEALPPDIEGELQRMQQQLLQIDENADLNENDYPYQGRAFATEVRLSCPVS